MYRRLTAMMILVLVLLAVAIVAGLAGWGADSRDADYGGAGLTGANRPNPRS
ncbi:MAG: hypothetical protein JWN95_9 [Frankiales bacterium]|nr:hypothetical protein [Frankiales bacterium]